MSRFKTQFMIGYEGTESAEVSYLPSLTIPDQSMSISELIERFTRGLPIEGEKVPLYEGDDFLPDLNKLDLAERQEYIEKFIQELEDMHTKQEQDEAERWRKKLYEELRPEWEAEFLEKNKNPEKNNVV